MSELQGLQLSQPAFAARDTEIVAVVVDPVERNAQVAESLDLAYRIGADPTLAAIDAFGLRHDDAATGLSMARPASFLIDAQGVVRWRDLTENYRYRPHPQALLAAIDSFSGLPSARPAAAP